MAICSSVGREECGARLRTHWTEGPTVRGPTETEAAGSSAVHLRSLSTIPTYANAGCTFLCWLEDASDTEQLQPLN